MLKSKTCLVDVNVWVALVSDRHEHHAPAREWFVGLPEASAVFCRVTQMGLLRLLTNARAMGEDVLSPGEAWEKYRALRRDWRVTFASEPAGMEEGWIGLMRGAAAGVSWTDAYLAAFGRGHGYTLVSFDRGFRRWANAGVMANYLGS